MTDLTTLDPALAAAADAAGVTADDLADAAQALRDRAETALRGAYRLSGVDLGGVGVLDAEPVGPWRLMAGVAVADGCEAVALLIPGVPALPLTPDEARHMADRLTALADLADGGPSADTPA